MRELPESAIVDEAGQVRFGVQKRPFEQVNLSEAVLAVGSRPMPRWWSQFRLKQWQHFCIVLPEALFSFAVVDARFLKLSWCHYAELETGLHFEHVRKAPLLKSRIARELWNDHSYLNARGYHVAVHSHLNAGHYEIAIDVQASSGCPKVQADLNCLHDLDVIEPLVVVLPVGPNRGMYSHKVPLPVQGEIVIDERRIVVDPQSAWAILDVHKAHYPRHTWWNWATFAGRDAQGHSVGLNLTRNINQRDDEYNENGVWIDGQLHPLGPARFAFDRSDVMKPWELGTVDGTVELQFNPRGERLENTRLGLVRSVFHQPYGTFEGRISVAGRSLQIADVIGVCEDHDALW